LLIFDCRLSIEKPAQSIPVFDFQSAISNQESTVSNSRRRACGTAVLTIFLLTTFA